MKPLSSLFLAAAILLPTRADNARAEAPNDPDQTNIEDEAELKNIATEAKKRIGTLDARPDEPMNRSEPPLTDASSPPPEKAASKNVVDFKKAAPKRAVIYVSPLMSERESLFTAEVRDEERAQLGSMGYQVTVREATTQNILDDLWHGVAAVSYFGHGGYKDESGVRHPSLADADSEGWKELVKRDFAVRYQAEQNLGVEEAGRRAAARAENFGLELVRNNSCFGLYDHSLAYRFVKPGGLYYGAKRWVSPSVAAQAIADVAESCAPDGFCRSVGKISAAHLTAYRVLEKPSEGAGIADSACAARAGHLERVVQDWNASGRGRAVYDAGAFWKSLGPDETAARLKLGRYLKLEDGAVAPVRTGKETAFYDRLKERLASHPQPGSVGMEELLRMGLDSCVGADGTANLQETFLTIHNVMRLLARPQQWAGGKIDSDYGHLPTDPAWPILQDLSDARSTAGQSLPQSLGLRRRADGTVMEPLWSMRRLFDTEAGPFQPQPGAVNDEWNAGCHYYYWIGALAHSTLGSLSVAYGAWGEMGAKQSQDKGEQGAVEISHFICGSKFAAQLYKERLGALAPGQPPSRPDCEALNPEGKNLDKGPFYAAYAQYRKCLSGATPTPAPTPAPKPAAPAKFRSYLFRVWPPERPKEVSYLLYLRIEETGHSGLFKFPDGNGGWYWRNGEVSGPFENEDGVCAVLRGYGQTSVSYNLGWDPHIECAKTGPVETPKLRQAEGRPSREDGTNRGGGDYRNFDLPSPDPELCREQCGKDPQCWAYTYVKPGVQGSQARCWLKSGIPAPKPDDCCVSGARP